MRVIFAVVGLALLGSCSPSLPLLDQIRLLGELRVVTQNAPTTFYYGANERYGIEFELAQAFADHLGVRLSVHEVDQSEQIIPSITNQNVHLAAAGLTVSDSTRQHIEFGPTYQEVSGLVIYRMGQRRPRSLADVAGKALEVRAGSAHIIALEQATARWPELSWSEFRSTSTEPLMQRVADGTVDYAVVKSNEFQLLRHYYPEIRVAFDLNSRSGLAWGLPRDASDLQEEVSAFFATIKSTGELQHILDRYYLAQRDFDFVGSRAFMRHLNQRLPRYREAFQQAERETGIDWKLLAAIAYQESHWNPEAVSPTGVKGLMMLTVNTARMVDVADRSDPTQSILGGARYLASVVDMFPDRIPDEDRLLMAVAAYNIGWGHVEDARIITESKNADKDSWDDVRDNLPLLSDESWYTGLKRGFARGSVSVQYVENVLRYYDLLKQLSATEIYTALASATPPSDDPI